jgi:large subunit ribosomal protein L6
MSDKQISLTVEAEDKQARSNWGTLASHIRNAITGVTEGFEKNLEIEGVGYKAAMKGKTLVLNLGFSHPIDYDAPEGVELAVDGQNKVSVKGISKQAVGQAAAEIRSDEIIRRKAGKKVGSE